MVDPVKAFMQAAGAEAPAFDAGSRYSGLPTARWTRPDGTEVAYVRRRFVPHPERFATAAVHVVGEGDRLDNLAVATIGDPSQYWRICDGNGAMRPAELVETVGVTLRIPLPEGFEEAPDE